MDKKTDKTVALLQLLAGLNPGASSQAQGLHIVTVKTINPTTFVMEGINAALDPDIFVIPFCYSETRMKPGQTYFALPIVGDTEAPRWGLIQRIT